MNLNYYTLGCKVNQYETEAVTEMFKNNGFTADNNQKPDIILINSCSVTAESDRKTRQLVRKVRRLHKNSVIILTGCMVQAFPEKAAELTEADIIIGNTLTNEIFAETEKFLKTKEKIVKIENHTKGEKYSTPCLTDFSERTRAYMKIEDGCDRFCSYCIIPYARGRVRSRSIESIKKEACMLARNGFKEIVLVGINLSAYGSDINLNICDAVDAVCNTKGIIRVRLGSVEPDHITEEILERLSKQKKFCPQFHLSLQSGCDETLKRMNRHYNSDFYYQLCENIHKKFDNPAITTDIMVGFNGETDEEFMRSCEFVEKVGFARSHVFAYSVRNGTVAANQSDKIPPEIKEKRAVVMGNTAKKCESEFLKTQIGKTCKVLFETGENGFEEGYSENYSRVAVKSDKNLQGKILTVKITGVSGLKCIGEII